MSKIVPSAFFICLFLASFVMSGFARADIRVVYTDTSPTDIITIENVSGCLLYKGEVTIDFTTSMGQLRFDIYRDGWGDIDSPGRGSYQPLIVVSGQQFVSSMSKVEDGDQKVTLEIQDFQHRDLIIINVDVDDTTGIVHPSVEGGEIVGASLRVTTPSSENVATFNQMAEAETDRTTCIS